MKINPLKTICLITPGHLCNCPRLIKEAGTLTLSGYRVHIIATSYMPFLVAQDEILIGKNPQWNIKIKDWQMQSVSGWINKIQHGLLKVLNRFLKLKAVYPYLLNRNFRWQLRKAKATKADLYIAHSAGSIAIAALAAAANGTKFIFDAEDYHTGEDLSSESLVWIDHLQKKYLPHACCIYAASPLIAEAYREYLKIPNIEVVLNVFPKNEIDLPTKKSAQPLRLFWFSQTIGKGRGLEWVFEALQGKKADEVELHLLGNMRVAESVFFDSLSKAYQLPHGMVYFHSTLAEESLLKFAKQFDIGLSLETGDPLNRDLCLSNKLFVYLYAGLGIIATDTSAQRDLFGLQAEGVILLPLKDPKALSLILSSLIQSPEKVMNMRQYNYDLAKKQYHWEKEQVKFISIVNQCL